MTEKRRGFKIWPYLVIVALAVIFIPKFREKKPEQAPVPQAGKTPVKTIVITEKVFNNTIHLTGTVYAGEQVDIRSEIAGRIVSLNIHEGQKVNKGDLLVK